MTRDEAKKILPIIKAYSEGKTIQQISPTGWTDIEDECFFIISPDNLRIKPEPKYRPFKDAEECWNEMQKHQPFGWVKHVKNMFYCDISLVSKRSGVYADKNWYSWTELLAFFVFADGTPFGIKEEDA